MRLRNASALPERPQRVVGHRDAEAFREVLHGRDPLLRRWELVDGERVIGAAGAREVESTGDPIEDDDPVGTHVTRVGDRVSATWTVDGKPPGPDDQQRTGEPDEPDEPDGGDVHLHRRGIRRGVSVRMGCGCVQRVHEAAELQRAQRGRSHLRG